MACRALVRHGAAGRAGDGTGRQCGGLAGARAGPLRAWGPLELELRVGLVPYDASFSRELLESRYRELYSCLSHNAEAFMTV